MYATSRTGDNRSQHTALFRPYVLTGLLTLAAIALLSKSLFQHLGLPLDDSWIHQTVARNLVRRGSPGYMPRQALSGSTSLLWTLLLAANYVVVPALNPALYCLAFNSACLLAISLVLLKLALKDKMPPRLAVLWAVSPMADGNFVWLGFTGMEHLLFVALSLASILLWVNPESNSLKKTCAAGVAMGLLAMTRPEGCVLVILLLLFYRKARRTGRDVRLAAVCAVPLACLPFAVNLYTSSSLLPLTLKGRQFLYFGPAGVTIEARLQLPVLWLQRIISMLSAHPANTTASRPHHLILLLITIVPLLLVLGLISLIKDRCFYTLLVCAWGLLHSLLYVVTLPATGHGGRYQPFLLMLLLPLTARGIYLVLTSIRLPAAMAVPVAAACLLLLGYISLRLWQKALENGIEHIEMSHGVMAEYLNKNLQGQTVAIFDIGRIGYTYHGAVLDLGGLTDASYASNLYSGRVPQYLQEHGIQYVVLPSDPKITRWLGLVPGPSLQLDPVTSACTPLDIWLPGYILTGHAAQCQQLFRIEYHDRAAGSPAAKVLSTPTFLASSPGASTGVSAMNAAWE